MLWLFVQHITFTVVTINVERCNTTATEVLVNVFRLFCSRMVSTINTTSTTMNSFSCCRFATIHSAGSCTSDRGMLHGNGRMQ